MIFRPAVLGVLALQVAKSLVKVTNQAGDTVKESITASEVEKMRTKIGDLQILRLVQAAMVASTQEPTMPVPLSPTNSNDDLDS
jgi:putative ubiquitin-RnfH superfamily antitoxin RatB of RatAB toxin-antitoxin module